MRRSAEVQQEVIARNGAVIVFEPVLNKWAVFGGDGALVGYRRGVERARAFAETLPPGPPPPEPPRPIPRSPRAMPLPEERAAVKWRELGSE